MQIVLNARKRHTKHIPEGTLMNQNKITKVLNSTLSMRMQVILDSTLDSLFGRVCCISLRNVMY